MADAQTHQQESEMCNFTVCILPIVLYMFQLMLTDLQWVIILYQLAR